MPQNCYFSFFKQPRKILKILIKNCTITRHGYERWIRFLLRAKNRHKNLSFTTKIRLLALKCHHFQYSSLNGKRLFREAAKQVPPLMARPLRPYLTHPLPSSLMTIGTFSFMTIKKIFLSLMTRPLPPPPPLLMRNFNLRLPFHI